ncbi:hypothetical protein [Variovorax sp. GB1P17]|uniref:hypothetical protein n=1 Tax=Variovorax sp. GB1P17 TaxID=3443740 RepID=UPI003F45B9C0
MREVVVGRLWFDAKVVGELHPVGAGDRRATPLCKAGGRHRVEHLGRGLADGLKVLSDIFLDRLGEGGISCFELRQRAKLGQFGFRVLHPEPGNWLSVESFCLAVDDDPAFLDSDAGHVRYASVCALALRDGSPGSFLWYMPNLWQAMYHRDRKNSAE